MADLTGGVAARLVSCPDLTGVAACLVCRWRRRGTTTRCTSSWSAGGWCRSRSRSRNERRGEESWGGRVMTGEWGGGGACGSLPRDKSTRKTTTNTRAAAVRPKERRSVSVLEHMSSIHWLLCVLSVVGGVWLRADTQSHSHTCPSLPAGHYDLSHTHTSVSPFQNPRAFRQTTCLSCVIHTMYTLTGGTPTRQRRGGLPLSAPQASSYRFSHSHHSRAERHHRCCPICSPLSCCTSFLHPAAPSPLHHRRGGGCRATGSCVQSVLYGVGTLPACVTNRLLCWRHHMLRLMII